jgi:cobalt/nickel transport system permease protein
MDELGRLDTPIHRLDARIKILTTLAFVIVVMSFPRYAIAALTPLAAYPLFLLIAGTIPLKDIAKKIAVAAPFALVIGIFNPIIDHTPALTHGSLVISQGWLSFASIMLRFLLTVSAALALVATTGMYRIGVGLEQMGFPRVFIMQLLFLYRYLFVVSEEALTMVRSVSCRGPSLARDSVANVRIPDRSVVAAIDGSRRANPSRHGLARVRRSHSIRRATPPHRQ